MTRTTALAALLFLSACAPTTMEQPSSAPPAAPAGAKYAVITTSMGRIVARLHTDKTPNTVAHFIGLATGTKEWRDPRDGQVKKTPIYDGVTFHRVIPGFMIQTGDPLGDGRGNIGYAIADEFRPDLRYDRPGKLGMANAGPNTNGSQFFITTVPTPHLDDRHSLFGEVVEGQSVAEAIAGVPRDSNDRPLKTVTIDKVEIKDKP